MLQEIDNLRALQIDFTGLVSSIVAQPKVWNEWLKSPNALEREMPFGYEHSLSDFQKLIFIKLVRPESLVPFIDRYIQSRLGAAYLPRCFDRLSGVLAEADHRTPVLFIVSPGVDFKVPLQQIVSAHRIPEAALSQISLGSGQEELAERLLKKACKSGSLLVLENCHLSKSFMRRMEYLLEKWIQENPSSHTGFRLLMTSARWSSFPSFVVSQCIKIALEPPKDIRSVVLNQLSHLTQQQFEIEKNKDKWQKLLFALSLMHAVCVLRGRYGPIGWSGAYVFSDGDFSISMTNLKSALATYDEVPLQIVAYMIGEINYGGCVTDEMDRRCLRAIVAKFCNQQVCDTQHHAFAESVHAPENVCDRLEDYVTHIAACANLESHELFGLHQSAYLSQQLAESQKMHALLTEVIHQKPAGLSSAAAQYAEKLGAVEKMCQQIEERMPQLLQAPANRTYAKPKQRFSAQQEAADGSQQQQPKQTKRRDAQVERADRRGEPTEPNAQQASLRPPETEKQANAPEKGDEGEDRPVDELSKTKSKLVKKNLSIKMPMRRRYRLNNPEYVKMKEIEYIEKQKLMFEQMESQQQPQTHVQPVQASPQRDQQQPRAAHEPTAKQQSVLG